MIVMIDVEHIKRYIRRNYPDIEGVEDVAEDLGISYESLRKSFRRKSSYTLKHFLRRVRVEHMKEQLEETDKYCYEICYEVGYAYQETGEKAFKRETDMTMGEYRRMNGGGGGIRRYA